MSGRRVLLTGDWQALTPLAAMLASEDDLEVAHDSQPRPDVVVHAIVSVDRLAEELAEVRRATCAPLVVLATEQSPGLLAQAAAVHDADVLLIDPDRPAAGGENVVFAVRKTLLAARGEARRARVFTIFSPKGGTGKSVTATNLAVALSRHEHKRVLLIDLDVQFGDVAIMLGLEPERTLFDALTAPGSLDEQKLASFTLRHSTGIDVLAAPGRPEEAESLTEDKIAGLLDVAAAAYDVVVVDTSPYFHGPMLSALDRTDELLLVSAPDVPSLKNLRLVLHTLEQISFPPARIRLVLNRAGERSGLGANDLTGALGLPVSFELPYDPVVPQGVNRGVPAVLAEDDGPFARAIRRTASELVAERAAASLAPARRLRGSLSELLLQRKKVLA